MFRKGTKKIGIWLFHSFLRHLDATARREFLARFESTWPPKPPPMPPLNVKIKQCVRLAQVVPPFCTFGMIWDYLLLHFLKLAFRDWMNNICSCVLQAFSYPKIPKGCSACLSKAGVAAHVFPILDLGFLPFIHDFFWKSWILDPDPRFLPWIQEKFFEHLGSWILTMSDLRFSNLNSFQTWDSSHRNWSKTKNKAWVSNKNII